MRRSVSFKLLAVSLVAYATWLLTDSLVAKPVAGDAGAIKSGKFKVANAPAQPAPVEGVAPTLNDYHPKLAASNRLVGYKVSVDGHAAVIHMAVNMMDRKGNLTYFWRLRVLDEQSGAAVIDWPYLDQQFRMHESGVMAPTFDERVRLRPGKYQARVTLYEKYDRFEAQQILEDEFLGRASTLINAWKSFEVK